MSKPLAVLISDIHYSLNTLTIADSAMLMAIKHANSLGVPLVVTGDLHDSKANMRAECVNAMIETFRLCEQPPVVLIGNHDKTNEKAETHALNFLEPYAMVVDQPKYIHPLGYFIPYQSDPIEFKRLIQAPYQRFFVHQGVAGSLSGEYIQDKSAVSVDDLPAKQIISGHYHTRQTISLPNGGSWDYVGNPYTLNYAEANDPPKGYQVLYSDGSLEFVPANLREHYVLDYTYQELKGEAIFLGESEDLVWVRIRGSKEELSRCTKDQIAQDLDISQAFRLDLIPTDTATQAPSAHLNLANGPLLDSLIDSLSATSNDRKARLKDLWKAL